MEKSYFKINNQIFIVMKIELLYVFNRLLGKYILLFYDSKIYLPNNLLKTYNRLLGKYILLS